MLKKSLEVSFYYYSNSNALKKLCKKEIDCISRKMEGGGYGEKGNSPSK